MLSLLDRYFSVIVSTIAFSLLGFATLAYIALFDPKASTWLGLTVKLIYKLCTPFE